MNDNRTMLPFRLIEPPPESHFFPLYLYSVGSHYQYRHSKPLGFPVYQFFLVRSGTGLFRDLTSGEEWKLEPGHAFLFPADRGHEYFPLSHEPWHISFIGFFGSIADSFLEGIGLKIATPFYPKRFEECWEEVGYIWQAVDNPYSTSQEEAYMQSISVSLFRFLLNLRVSEQSKEALQIPTTEVSHNEVLQKALRLMNQHFTEPLLISNLARAVGYSVQHFQLLFQQEYGVTPNKYLQNLRLERAMQLIKESPSMPIQEVAHNIGMEPSYLIRLFRKTYGKTPGNLRKKITLNLGGK